MNIFELIKIYDANYIKFIGRSAQKITRQLIDERSATTGCHRIRWAACKRGLDRTNWKVEG